MRKLRHKIVSLTTNSYKPGLTTKSYGPGERLLWLGSVLQFMLYIDVLWNPTRTQHEKTFFQTKLGILHSEHGIAADI